MFHLLIDFYNLYCHKKLYLIHCLFRRGRMETIQYTISGMTQDGQKFRPSDWTERLVCTQPEQLKRYSGHLKIQRVNGVKSIVFDDQLKYACAFTFERLVSFAKTNHLLMTEEAIKS